MQEVGTSIEMPSAIFLGGVAEFSPCKLAVGTQSIAIRSVLAAISATTHVDAGVDEVPEAVVFVSSRTGARKFFSQSRG